MPLFDPFDHLLPLSPLPTHLVNGGSLRRPIQTLLCDIYGTLLVSGSGDIGHSAPQAYRDSGVRRFLRKYNVDLSPVELLTRLTSAVKAHHAEAQSNGIDFPEVRIERIWQTILSLQDVETARQFAAEYELITNPVWPMPHLVELLDACRRSGIRLGIISNAQFYTPMLFEWLLGNDLNTLGFDPDLVIFSYEQGRAKPSDKLFDLACRRLLAKGVTPGRTAFIGNDMRNDIAPATRKGFQTILFAGDARSLRLRENEIGTSTQPDRVITDLAQLIDELSQV
jgi:putative hydrolase of the HAD superfamily